LNSIFFNFKRFFQREDIKEEEIKESKTETEKKTVTTSIIFQEFSQSIGYSSGEKIKGSKPAKTKKENNKKENNIGYDWQFLSTQEIAEASKQINNKSKPLERA
jgi:hypothetical protein